MQATLHSPAGHPVHDRAAAFLRRVAGPEITPEAVEPFDLTSHMDASYPPVYLTANEDDHTAPFSNSLTVAEICESSAFLTKTRFGKTGDHGFGLGIGLEVEGAGLESSLPSGRKCAKRRRPHAL